MLQDNISYQNVRFHWPARKTGTVIAGRYGFRNGSSKEGIYLKTRENHSSAPISRVIQSTPRPSVQGLSETMIRPIVPRSPTAPQIHITPRPKLTSVCVLAESRLVREALSVRLNAEGNVRVARSAPYSPEVLETISSETPDILLIDSEFLVRAGFRVIADAHLRMPTVKVVLVDMAEDRETFLDSARVGISGYLLQDASADEVMAAIHCVAQGEAVCPPRLCALLFACISRQCMRIPGLFGKLNFGLTRREQQVIQLMSCGLSNKEIGSEMHLSDQTVKRHVHQILHKVGAGDRVTAIELCRLHATCA